MGASWRPNRSPHPPFRRHARLGLSRGRRPNPARHFVGFFGVRELVLGGLLVAAWGDLRQLRPLVALGALADIGDSAVLLRELLCRHHSEPGAHILMGTGLSGSAASVAVWLELQRFFRGA